MSKLDDDMKRFRRQSVPKTDPYPSVKGKERSGIGEDRVKRDSTFTISAAARTCSQMARAGLAMAYPVLLLAERSWRRLDGQELLPLVRLGMLFKDGVRIERDVGQVALFMKRILSVHRKVREKVAA